MYQMSQLLLQLLLVYFADYHTMLRCYFVVIVVVVVAAAAATTTAAAAAAAAMAMWVVNIVLYILAHAYFTKTFQKENTISVTRTIDCICQLIGWIGKNHNLFLIALD